MSNASLGARATIGLPVIGGTATRILFVDASGNLGQDADLIFDYTTNELRLGGAATQNAKFISKTEAADNYAIFVDANTTKFNQPSDIFTGNVGSTAYRLSDVVKALKNIGVLAQ